MTTEEIVLKFKEQDAKIQSLESEIAAFKLKQASLVGNELKKLSKAELPKIPTDLVSYKQSKYKWAYPTFRLPGDATLHLAEEAQFDEEMIKKIIAIPGQNVLLKQE